jgi:hypothetical protein
MNKATIEITGLGPVQINTELKEVRLVRAFTVSGDYVNVVKKKVSRNKKTASLAALNRRFWLKELETGYFMLCDEYFLEESEAAK